MYVHASIIVVIVIDLFSFLLPLFMYLCTAFCIKHYCPLYLRQVFPLYLICLVETTLCHCCGEPQNRVVTDKQNRVFTHFNSKEGGGYAKPTWMEELQTLLPFILYSMNVTDTSNLVRVSVTFLWLLQHSLVLYIWPINWEQAYVLPECYCTFFLSVF